MTDGPRGIVVPFRRPERPAGGRVVRRGRGCAASAAPWLDRLLEDDLLNADWDRLVTLVMHAWCWRDPESLAALETCLRSLRSSVDRDWS